MYDSQLTARRELAATIALDDIDQKYGSSGLALLSR
jgi:hypothetical protein